MQQLWAKNGIVQIWDIGFGHYVAKFSSLFDSNQALNEGPWLIGDHYVISEPWRPYFEPGDSPISKLRVWVRLPNLPLECFDEFILTSIGNIIGKTVHIDHTTLNGCRGNYARICVEIDITQKLKSKYRLWRRVRRGEYEGLHVVCFNCRVYGYSREVCPQIAVTVNEEDVIPEGSKFSNPMFQAFPADLPRPKLEEDFGTWMLAKKNMRRKSKFAPAKVSGEEVGSGQAKSKGSRFEVLADDPSEVAEEAQPEVPLKKDVSGRVDNAGKVDVDKPIPSDEVVVGIPGEGTSSPAVSKDGEVKDSNRSSKIPRLKVQVSKSKPESQSARSNRADAGSSKPGTNESAKVAKKILKREPEPPDGNKIQDTRLKKSSASVPINVDEANLVKSAMDLDA
ncbi:hypothetical protein LINPERPRIM_LOCUS24168 [Linum perenne]